MTLRTQNKPFVSANFTRTHCIFSPPQEIHARHFLLLGHVNLREPLKSSFFYFIFPDMQRISFKTNQTTTLQIDVWTVNVPVLIRSLSALTCSKQVEVWVGTQHPEAVVITAEGLYSGPFGHVPHPDALVLRVGQNELLAWVEDGTRHVVVVPTACIELPCLGLWTQVGGKTKKRRDN